MKKNFSKLLATLGLCALTFTACEKQDMGKKEAPKKQEASKDTKSSQKGTSQKKSSY